MKYSGRLLVRFFPQVQLGHKSAFAEPLQEVSVSSVSIVDDVADLRKKLDWRLWNAIAEKDWSRWESTIALFKSHDLPFDEVSYTLLLHGHLLSHHHPASVGLVVIESMKKDNMHPAIVKLNESLVTSYFELLDIGIRSSANGWQNLTRLAWMSAARLRKKRMQRVRQHIASLPTKEVMQLTASDVKALIDAEHKVAQLVSSVSSEMIEEDDKLLLDH
jgi:hypothetical protein